MKQTRLIYRLFHLNPGVKLPHRVNNGGHVKMGSSPFILAPAEEPAQSLFQMPFGVLKRSRIQKADNYAVGG